MKMFYFSRLKSRIVAIFDNDAEGYCCQSSLLNEIKDLPLNMKILTYPYLDEVKRYPTLSPSGNIEYIDINRKACSIELYLPDFLIKDKGTYYPIIWETRKEIKQNKNYIYLYQGVIDQKDFIKKNFFEYKNLVLQEKTKVELSDWGKMRKLLESILFCFK